MFPLTVKFGDAAKGTFQVRECVGIKQPTKQGPIEKGETWGRAVPDPDRTTLFVTGLTIGSSYGGYGTTIETIKIDQKITEVFAEMEAARKDNRIASLGAPSP